MKASHYLVLHPFCTNPEAEERLPVVMGPTDFCGIQDAADVPEMSLMGPLPWHTPSTQTGTVRETRDYTTPLKVKAEKAIAAFKREENVYQMPGATGMFINYRGYKICCSVYNGHMWVERPSDMMLMTWVDNPAEARNYIDNKHVQRDAEVRRQQQEDYDVMFGG